MKIEVTLTESEVQKIVLVYLEKRYPECIVSMPVSKVFETGDQFDRPTGHSFHMSASLTPKEGET